MSTTKRSDIVNIAVHSSNGTCSQQWFAAAWEALTLAAVDEDGHSNCKEYYLVMRENGIGFSFFMLVNV